jgi:hypothetical protein
LIVYTFKEIFYLKKYIFYSGKSFDLPLCNHALFGGKMIIKIKVLENGNGLPIPKKATAYSACVDLYAAYQEFGSIDK